MNINKAKEIIRFLPDLPTLNIYFHILQTYSDLPYEVRYPSIIDANTLMEIHNFDSDFSFSRFVERFKLRLSQKEIKLYKEYTFILAVQNADLKNLEPEYRNFCELLGCKDKKCVYTMSMSKYIETRHSFDEFCDIQFFSGNDIVSHANQYNWNIFYGKLYRERANINDISPVDDITYYQGYVNNAICKYRRLPPLESVFIEECEKISSLHGGLTFPEFMGLSEGMVVQKGNQKRIYLKEHRETPRNKKDPS